jgi:inhibitor of cysteine peptidase
VKDIGLTEADSGTTVSADPGDTIVVRLPENPTTGYRWEVAGGPSPSADDFTSAGTGQGAGGERTLRFTAQPGPITLVLKRPWESDKPQATFSISVAVS